MFTDDDKAFLIDFASEFISTSMVGASVVFVTLYVFIDLYNSIREIDFSSIKMPWDKKVSKEIK